MESIIRYQSAFGTLSHFPRNRGITHTNTINEVSFAQAGRDFQALGTVYAEYSYRLMRRIRRLTQQEAEETYEPHTGKVIIEGIREH